jgi:lysophospholipase L1-like esterase
MNRRQFLALAAFAALPAPRPRLVAFGDSITVGVGASAPDRAYAALVAAAYGRCLVNRAASGSRIVEQLAAIKATPLLPTDLVVFLAGYNDMRAGTPLDEYGAMFDEALGRLRPASVIVGTCLRMSPFGYTTGAPTWSHGGDDAVDAINAVIVPMAARHGCRIANTTDAYDPTNTNDFSHPNDAGHAQIAAVMVARLWLPLVERGYSDSPH